MIPRPIGSSTVPSEAPGDYKNKSQREKNEKQSQIVCVFNFLNFVSFMVNIVYFADIQLDPEKLRNRQILLVLTVLECYYGTEVEMFVFLTIQ